MQSQCGYITSASPEDKIDEMRAQFNASQEKLSKSKLVKGDVHKINVAKSGKF